MKFQALFTFNIAFSIPTFIFKHIKNYLFQKRECAINVCQMSTYKMCESKIKYNSLTGRKFCIRK